MQPKAQNHLNFRYWQSLISSTQIGTFLVPLSRNSAIGSVGPLDQAQVMMGDAMRKKDKMAEIEHELKVEPLLISI